jgi:hybrid cluster-associated redox disulfide protein
MTITKEMSIADIVHEHPETIRVFFSHGLMCVGCAAARFENLEQGARAHGIDVEALVKDLNASLVEEEAVEN